MVWCLRHSSSDLCRAVTLGGVTQKPTTEGLRRERRSQHRTTKDLELQRTATREEKLENCTTPQRRIVRTTETGLLCRWSFHRAFADSSSELFSNRIPRWLRLRTVKETELNTPTPSQKEERFPGSPPTLLWRWVIMWVVSGCIAQRQRHVFAVNRLLRKTNIATLSQDSKTKDWQTVHS